MKLIDVQRIWDQAPHNAFTDLIRFQDKWYCVFREGQAHVSPDGALRVISSADGSNWNSTALLTSNTGDLRDAKLTITPDGKLMMSGAEAINRPGQSREQGTLQSLAWFSADGGNWSKKHKIGDPNFWLWRTTWHQGNAYAIGYGCRSEKGRLRLYTSDDGINFKTHVDTLLLGGYPNETSIVFADNDTAYCLLRRDGEEAGALLGIAQPPYTEWQWKDLGIRAGGPHMIRLPDGRFIAAVRLYDDPKRTSLCQIDVEKGNLEEKLQLPSGGDTSYAGLVYHQNRLWVSYYSSHQEKTCIYLARVST